jgi:hypothetical protein
MKGMANQLVHLKSKSKLTYKGSVTGYKEYKKKTNGNVMHGRKKQSQKEKETITKINKQVLYFNKLLNV